VVGPTDRLGRPEPLKWPAARRDENRSRPVMNKALNSLLALCLLACRLRDAPAQSTQMSTYRNPINLDYAYMIYAEADDRRQ